MTIGLAQARHGAKLKVTGQGQGLGIYLSDKHDRPLPGIALTRYCFLLPIV